MVGQITCYWKICGVEHCLHPTVIVDQVFFCLTVLYRKECVHDYIEDVTSNMRIATIS